MVVAPVGAGVPPGAATTKVGTAVAAACAAACSWTSASACSCARAMAVSTALSPVKMAFRASSKAPNATVSRAV